MFPSRSLPSTDLHGANAGHVSERWFQCNGHLGYDTSNMSTKCTNHWKHLETLKVWFRPALKSNSMPLVTPPFVFNKHILVTSPIVRFVLTRRQSPGPHHSSAQAQYHLSTSGSTRSGFGLWHLKWKHLSLTGIQTLQWFLFGSDR